MLRILDMLSQTGDKEVGKKETQNLHIFLDKPMTASYYSCGSLFCAGIEFLNLYYCDKLSDEYMLEIANETYYPWLYYEKEMKDRNRLLAFINTSHHLPLWHIPYFLNNDSNLKEPIIANNSGYSIYPESLMMGFSKTMYFSKDENALNDIIDQKTSNSSEGFVQEQLPDSIKSGDYAKSLQNGVNFFVFNGNISSGREFYNVNEIILSNSLFDELGYQNLGENLYVMTSKNEVLTSGNKIIKD